LGAYAHLSSEAKLSPICESSGGIPVHGRRVHPAQKLTRVTLIPGNDGFGMMSGMPIDMFNSLVQAGNNPNRYAEPKVFLRPILRSGGANVCNESAGSLITSYFDMTSLQLADDPGHILGCNLLVHQQFFGCVAD
jgi:hypothetical protein